MCLVELPNQRDMERSARIGQLKRTIANAQDSAEAEEAEAELARILHNPQLGVDHG